MVTLMLLLLAQMPVLGRWTRVGGTTTMSPVASSTLGRSSSSVRTCTHTQTPLPFIPNTPSILYKAPLSAPIFPLCCFTPYAHLSPVLLHSLHPSLPCAASLPMPIHSPVLLHSLCPSLPCAASLPIPIHSLLYLPITLLCPSSLCFIPLLNCTIIPVLNCSAVVTSHSVVYLCMCFECLCMGCVHVCVLRAAVFVVAICG